MGKTFHILPMIGAAIHPLRVGLTGWSGGWTPIEYGNEFIAGYTGYDITSNEWRFDSAGLNYGAIIGTALLSKLMSKLGVNKMLPKGVNL